jgi:hypothetical protein
MYVQAPYLVFLTVYSLLLLSTLCKSVVRCFDEDMKAEIDQEMHGFVNHLNHDYPVPNDNVGDVLTLPGNLVHEEDDDHLPFVDIEENNGQDDALVDENPAGTNIIIKEVFA